MIIIPMPTFYGGDGPWWLLAIILAVIVGCAGVLIWLLVDIIRNW